MVSRLLKFSFFRGGGGDVIIEWSIIGGGLYILRLASKGCLNIRIVASGRKPLQSSMRPGVQAFRGEISDISNFI